MNYRFIFNPSSQLRPTVIVSTCMAVSEVLRKVLCKRLAEAPCLRYQEKQWDLPLKNTQINILNIAENLIKSFVPDDGDDFWANVNTGRSFCPGSFSLCSPQWVQLKNNLGDDLTHLLPQSHLQRYTDWHVAYRHPIKTMARVIFSSFWENNFSSKKLPKAIILIRQRYLTGWRVR